MLAHDAARSGSTTAEVRPPFERKWYRLFPDEGLMTGTQARRREREPPLTEPWWPTAPLESQAPPYQSSHASFPVRASRRHIKNTDWPFQVIQVREDGATVEVKGRRKELRIAEKSEGNAR
jgi:hypothetical protein